MSTVVYSNDNLSIIGDIIKHSLQNNGGETDEFYGLKLIFNVHVNGKLKIVEHHFDLEKDEDNKSLILKDWAPWYTVLNTFTDLGYKIADYERGGIGSGIIRTWIDRLQ